MMSENTMPVSRVSDFPEVVAPMPSPEVYEQEYMYWPWGCLLGRACAWLRDRTPRGGLVLDYMCGTGYLLSKLCADRKDVKGVGCDISRDFVQYGIRRYANIELLAEDAMVYRPPAPPDVVVCTAGIHHLPERLQTRFVEKVASELKHGGYLLVGEELLADFSGEAQRRHAVMALWWELMEYAILKGSSPPVLEAACTALGNDLVQRGEYKLTYRCLIDLLASHFDVEESFQIWPKERAFGDWLLVCRRIV